MRLPVFCWFTILFWALPKKFSSLENPRHATSRRRFIIWCVTSEMHNKRCVNEGKWRASLRRAGKILARTGGIPSGSWICLKHRKEMNRNDKRCSCPSSRWHSRKLAKIPNPNHLYLAFDQLGESFRTTNLGQTGALNAKSRRTKNSRRTENTYRAKETPATNRR